MKRLLYRRFWGQPFRNSFFAALQYSLRETHGVHPHPLTPRNKNVSLRFSCINRCKKNNIMITFLCNTLILHKSDGGSNTRKLKMHF